MEIAKGHGDEVESVHFISEQLIKITSRALRLYLLSSDKRELYAPYASVVGKLDTFSTVLFQ